MKDILGGSKGKLSLCFFSKDGHLVVRMGLKACCTASAVAQTSTTQASIAQASIAPRRPSGPHAGLTLTSLMPDPAAAGPKKTVMHTDENTRAALISAYSRKEPKYLGGTRRHKSCGASL